MSRYHTAYLLIEAAGKKRVKYLATKHGFTEGEIHAMAEFDPSKNDKFLGWIAAQAKANELSIPTNGPELKNLLEDFERKGKLTGEPNINKWTFTGLREKLSATESKGEVNRSKVEEGQRVFYDKPPWKVIEITTPEAANKLLSMTAWCIKDPKFWDNYGCGTGAPAYLVLKNGERYACMVPHRNQLKDTYDEPLKPTEEFIDLLYQQLGWVDLVYGDFSEFAPYQIGIEEVSIDPELAFQFAREVVKGRWPKGEDAIASDPTQARMYIDFLMERNDAADGGQEQEKALVRSLDGYFMDAYASFAKDRARKDESLLKELGLL